jgi:hypothetical protein
MVLTHLRSADHRVSTVIHQWYALRYELAAPATDIMPRLCGQVLALVRLCDAHSRFSLQ